MWILIQDVIIAQSDLISKINCLENVNLKKYNGKKKKKSKHRTYIHRGKSEPLINKSTVYKEAGVSVKK